MAFVFRPACATGLIGSDDLGYSEFAQRIAVGTYELEPHHYAICFGLIVPVAVLYRLFGVTEWTTIALPLVASTLAVPVLTLIGRRIFGWRVGVITGITNEARTGGFGKRTNLESAETAGDGGALSMRQIERAEMSGDGGEGREQAKYFKAE